MAEVGARMLRNQTREVLQRVGRGEPVTVTVDGRPVAVLQPLKAQPRWVSRDEFLQRILASHADPALTADLLQLAPDTTDSSPL